MARPGYARTKTMEQCEILCRTLRPNPSFGSWLKVLHLPRGREKSPTDISESGPTACTATDVRLLQLSADTFGVCDMVQDIDIMAKIDLFSDPYEHTYLRSIRVTNANSKLGGPRPARIIALRELTLSRFRFDGSRPDSTADSVWPEFSQLRKLRLEYCVLVNEDLTEIESSRTVGPNCLEELCLEDCWPRSFELSLRSYRSLRTVHVDWCIFSKAALFLPIGVRTISAAVSTSVASSAPDYATFEATPRSAATELPFLETVMVRGNSEYPLLQDALGLKERV